MSDPRLNPDPTLVKMHQAACIILPVADLNRRPDGPRDRQLIYGDAVTILNEMDGWCYVQANKDQYCGYVAQDALGAAQAPTHHITAPATHAYAEPNLKSPDQTSLTFSSLITVTGTSNQFAKTTLGYIPAQHISSLYTPFKDPAAIALLFLGTPYLWGGNSRWGIDCSGLIQAALLACAIPCPGDSDQQQSLGMPAARSYQRNDLLFWKGHVALVTDPNTLIHANAGSMSTNFEGIAETIKRIQSAGDGPVTAHRRL
jgi:cell wall-associated NlpC family hydrolase